MDDLDMEKIADSVYGLLERYGFRVAATNVFSKEPPPEKIAQAIFEIKKRAAIGILTTEQYDERWLGIGWSVYIEIDDRFVDKISDLKLPKQAVILNGGYAGYFIIRYKETIPYRELTKQLKIAIFTLALARNRCMPVIRDYRFLHPIMISIVPPKCAAGKKIGNMGNLGKLYSMAWLAAQTPYRFPPAQRSELLDASKKWKWHSQQGVPIYQK